MNYVDGEAFSAFILHQGIKLHFNTPSYDFVKYKGAVQFKPEHFEIRRDKYSYYKLARRRSVSELKKFYIANFLVGKGNWVGDLLKVEADDIYRKWLSVNQSLTYTFMCDIKYIVDQGEWVDLIAATQNGYPKLLAMYYSNKITLETLVILDDIKGFMKLWSTQIEETVVFPETLKIARKYRPFLTYDKKKFSGIFDEILTQVG